MDPPRLACGELRFPTLSAECPPRTVATESSSATRSAPARLAASKILARAPDDDAIDIALGAALIARDVYVGFDVRAGARRARSDFAAPLVRRTTWRARLAGQHQAARLGDGASLRDARLSRQREGLLRPAKNSLLPDVLDAPRMGIPITLAIVYCVKSRGGSACRPVGVGFPGHSPGAHRADARVDRRRAPLIVDPLRRRRVARRGGAATRMLARAGALGDGAELQESITSLRRRRAPMLVRMLTNLKAVYLQRGDHARAHLALDRIVSPHRASGDDEQHLVNGAERARAGGGQAGCGGSRPGRFGAGTLARSFGVRRGGHSRAPGAS